MSFVTFSAYINSFLIRFRHHPDKKKSDEGPERFIEIQEAYQILTDEKAKEACDALLQAKKQREQRENEMDKKRKADIDRLHEREKVAKQRFEDEVSAERRFETELSRMRARNKEMMKEAEERRRVERERQNALVGSALSESRTVMAQAAELSRTVRARWPRKGAVDSATLEAICEAACTRAHTRKSAWTALHSRRSPIFPAARSRLGHRSVA